MNGERTKLKIVWTTGFKTDYKLMKKRGMNLDLLKQVVNMLAMGEVLPAKYRDHALTGNWLGNRECHIKPDWLLVYRIEDDCLILNLFRTGTHSDIFDE